VAIAVTSCVGVEEKRIRELLNEKGFGTRAQGVATLENYISGGDAVVFFLDPSMLIQPGFEQLALLASPQQVGLDGTIHVPYVGNLMVLGLTERELEDLVGEQLQGYYNVTIEFTARILNLGKAFYVFGETLRKGRMPMINADLTILEAISSVGTTSLANIGRIQLIRPDAENPLVMEINFREIVLTGRTTYNILLQDNDIIYVPPTVIGVVTRFIQKLLQPLNVIVSGLFGLSQAQFQFEVLTGERAGFGGRRFFTF
jgi:protein involved in polysaccharide export with SLBB domain